MELSARSLDLNPIKHIWDYLDKQVQRLKDPPVTLDMLEIAPIEQ